MNYNTIGKSITMQCKVSEMSGRDKVNLLIDLLYDSGITPALLIAREIKAIDIIDEQIIKVWNEGR